MKHEPLQKLVVLSPSQPEMARETCLRSTTGDHIILYLETIYQDSTEHSHLGQVDVDYDIQPVTSLSSSLEDMEGKTLLL